MDTLPKLAYPFPFRIRHKAVLLQRQKRYAYEKDFVHNACMFGL